MDEHSTVNRAFWDEIAPHHAASDYYDLAGFTGATAPDSLGDIEKRELGPVDGAMLCHLQCHIGLDTLSLAARGATATGLDFSAESLDIARGLSSTTGIPAEFVRADVLDAAEVLDTAYDIVFTTRGVLMWIGDLERWARTCARLLRPGGVFYLLDIHPLAMVLHRDGDGSSLRLAADYFGNRRPSVVSKDESYAVRDVGLANRETREWIHPVGDVLSALAAAGIEIEFLHEHPQDGDGAATGGPALPALYSIRGRKAPG